MILKEENILLHFLIFVKTPTPTEKYISDKENGMSVADILILRGGRGGGVMAVIFILT